MFTLFFSTGTFQERAQLVDVPVWRHSDVTHKAARQTVHRARLQGQLRNTVFEGATGCK